jgi:hypothetical protein
MKSYKEHSQLERANMTSDDVESLLKIELMGAGIVEVKSPTKPVPPPKFEPALEGLVFQPTIHAGYERSLDFAFLNEEDSAVFAKMQIVKLTEDYDVKLKTVERTEGPTKISIVSVVSEEMLKQAKKAKKECSVDLTSYNIALDEYDTYRADRDEVLDPVWEDWGDMRSIHMKSQHLLSVFNEYVDTCDGDEELAMKFLKKAYTDKAIQEAYEFLEMDRPVLEGMAV